MDLTCLNISLPLPDIPLIANESNIFNHSAYKPNSGGITQMISAALAHLTFSKNDIESLLTTVANKNMNSWTVSEITKTKPIPSIIIYVSMALALFLSFSLTFCGTSCRKYRGRKQEKSKALQIGACLLVIVYLLGIGDMIYVAYRVNKSKTSIDDTIKQINRDVYPKEISEHIMYLNNEIKILDDYCVKSNSILINASKSMLVTTFEKILNEKYLVEDISQIVNSIDTHIQDLSDEIAKEPNIPQIAIEIFQDIQSQYRSMIASVELPLKEFCTYTNGTKTNIDEKLLDALKVVHIELERVIKIINDDVISEMTPWQDHLLMNIDFEEKIRSYISLGGTIFLVLVVVLAMIPVVFFVFILISYLFGCDREESCDNSKNHYRMNTMSGVSDDGEYYRRGSANSRSRIAPVHYSRSKKEPSRVLLCLMRIGFGLMMIMLFVMILLTGVFYTLDLAIQGACRTVHDDQPFLVNFVTERLIKSNIVLVNSTAMNTTILNVINDCRDNVHFSRKLLQNYWSILDHDVADMMNTLSKQIYDQFSTAIKQIDIPEDIRLLTDFINKANVSNSSNIPEIVQGIDTDLTEMEGLFEKINSSSSALPPSLVQSTIDKFRNYVTEVLESTIDGCPLPLATIYKTDTLVCHTMGGSLSGLWLSVFFFMAFVMVGLCIFGLCIYKRLAWSPEHMSSKVQRF